MNESLILFFNGDVAEYNLDQLEYDLIDYYRPVLNILKTMMKIISCLEKN